MPTPTPHNDDGVLSFFVLQLIVRNFCVEKIIAFCLRTFDYLTPGLLCGIDALSLAPCLYQRGTLIMVEIKKGAEKAFFMLAHPQKTYVHIKVGDV